MNAFRYFRIFAGRPTLVLSLTILFLGGLTLLEGPVPIDVYTLLSILGHLIGLPTHHYTRETYAIVTELRLLSIVSVLISGAALGLSGAVMQSLLRNPLADPSLLGISSSAGLGVVIAALCFGITQVWIPTIAALTGSLIGVILLYALSRHWTSGGSLKLILAGIALNALLNALSLFLISIADTHILQSVFFWSLGGTSGIHWTTTGLAAILTLIGSILLYRQASALNVLCLGECDAQSTGVDVRVLRILCVIGVAVSISASVILTGPVAFVGLMVPHVLRAWVGPNPQKLIPVSGLGGAALLLFAYWLSRQFQTVSDIPLGVVTALLGAPFFLGLLWKKQA